MKQSDIIFLGAGASISEGGPSQADLFKEFFVGYNQTKFTEYLTAYEGVGSADGLDKMYERLANFFDTFFSVQTNNIDNLANCIYPTFEEVLGILELAINRQESFKGFYCNADEPNIQKIREDLIFLIALVLDERLHRGHGNHTKLLDRLREEDNLSKTCFISLNYDILIDKAINDFNNEYILDYGINFTNYGRSSEHHQLQSLNPLLLYKLHGSLNWLYCPTCLSMTLFRGKIVAELIYTPQYCYRCKTKMIPIIIPPTFFKVMSNQYLQQIWMKTEHVLRGAKRIFFCGYSFPDADIHIKYLLKRAEVFKSSTTKIFVVNNHSEKKSYERKLEKQRYKRFFNQNSKVYYKYISFEEFCDAGITK